MAVYLNSTDIKNGRDFRYQNHYTPLFFYRPSSSVDFSKTTFWMRNTYNYPSPAFGSSGTEALLQTYEDALTYNCQRKDNFITIGDWSNTTNTGITGHWKFTYEYEDLYFFFGIRSILTDEPTCVTCHYGKTYVTRPGRPTQWDEPSSAAYNVDNHFGAVKVRDKHYDRPILNGGAFKDAYQGIPSSTREKIYFHHPRPGNYFTGNQRMITPTTSQTEGHMYADDDYAGMPYHSRWPRDAGEMYEVRFGSHQIFAGDHRILVDCLDSRHEWTYDGDTFVWKGQIFYFTKDMQPDMELPSFIPFTGDDTYPLTDGPEARGAGRLLYFTDGSRNSSLWNRYKIWSSEHQMRNDKILIHFCPNQSSSATDRDTYNGFILVDNRQHQGDGFTGYMGFIQLGDGRVYFSNGNEGTFLDQANPIWEFDDAFTLTSFRSWIFSTDTYGELTTAIQCRFHPIFLNSPGRGDVVHRASAYGCNRICIASTNGIALYTRDGDYIRSLSRRDDGYYQFHGSGTIDSDWQSDDDYFGIYEEQYGHANTESFKYYRSLISQEGQTHNDHIVIKNNLIFVFDSNWRFHMEDHTNSYYGNYERYLIGAPSDYEIEINGRLYIYNLEGVLLIALSPGDLWWNTGHGGMNHGALTPQYWHWDKFMTDGYDIFLIDSNTADTFSTITNLRVEDTLGGYFEPIIDNFRY